MEKKKKIIGLLGGIASGKTTAAKELQKLGCGVVDADRIVHELLETDDIIRQITGSFGKTILTGNRHIDRQKLANIVFDSSENLKKLNSIIHPEVLKKTRWLIEHFNGLDDIKAIVLDMPLLLEVGWQKIADVLIFVKCNDSSRACRALKKGGSDKKQLKKRENFQISLDRKAKIADYIVDNNSKPEVLAEQVVSIFKSIMG